MKRKIKLTREDLQRLVTESVNEILNSENSDGLINLVDPEELVSVKRDADEIYNKLADFTKKLKKISNDFGKRSHDIQLEKPDDDHYEGSFYENYRYLENIMSQLDDIAYEYDSFNYNIMSTFNSINCFYDDLLKIFPFLKEKFENYKF